MSENAPEIGGRYYLRWGEHNSNNKTIHIVGVVDKDMVVYKWWSKHSQEWNYVVKPLDWMKWCISQGILNKV